MTRTRLVLVFAAAVLAAAPAFAGDPPKPAPPQPAAKAPPAAPEKKAPAEIVKGVDWQPDLETATALARKQGKGVLVYLTPDWFL